MPAVKEFKDKVTSSVTRPVYTYEVPKHLANGITSVGLVQLTAHEEMLAAKRASGDTIRMAYEQVKQAIVEVNGERVSVADGSADTALEKMDPKLRNLVMSAHAKLHAPSDDEVNDFLNSRAVRA